MVYTPLQPLHTSIHSADVQAEASFQQPRTIEIDHCRRSFFAEVTAD
jgi:hypothetical protein